MSKIRNYINNLAVKHGFNPAYAKISDWVFSQEIAGNKNFSHEAFDGDCEARAALLIPCRLKENDYKHVHNVLTYAIMKHRLIAHGDDYRNQMERLELDLSEEEKNLISLDDAFWGGED